MRYGLVERRRRTAARAALYSALLLTGVGVTFAARHLMKPPPVGRDTSWVGTDWEREPATRLLQQYVRIDSNTVDGDELAAALFLATPLQAAGIPVHVERLGERHANLWAVLEGEDPRALVLHSHLDVEPVPDAARWKHPPFAGVIDGPWIYGRGTFDMKSYTVAQLLAVLRLHARTPRPRRSVILLATSGEERGSDLGMRWVLREHPELVARFWAVLTEGGVVEARNLESIKYWGTEVGQKRFDTLLACAPTRERLELLREDILRVGYQPTGLTLDPDIRRLWSIYRASRDSSDIRDLMADPERLPRDPARFEQLPPYLRAMLRDELVPFRPQPAPGGGWQMKLIFHLLPGSDADRVHEELLPAALTGGVTLTRVTASPPAAASPIEHPVMKAIEEQLRADLDVPLAGPFFLNATATDARFLRPLGIPSYGFSPFFILSTDTLNVDNPNEHIAVPGFLGGIGVYERLVARLAE